MTSYDITSHEIKHCFLGEILHFARDRTRLPRQFTHVLAEALSEIGLDDYLSGESLTVWPRLVI